MQDSKPVSHNIEQTSCVGLHQFERPISENFWTDWDTRSHLPNAYTLTERASTASFPFFFCSRML